MIPPSVSIPSDKGATSSSNNSDIFSDLLLPLRIAACTVAPYATASSGLIELHSDLPPKNSEISCFIFGIRVDPPTSTISFILFLDILASNNTFSIGCIHFLK